VTDWTSPRSYAESLQIPAAALTWRRRWLAGRRYWAWQAVGGALLIANEFNNALTPPVLNPWPTELLRITLLVAFGLGCAHLLRLLLLALRLAPPPGQAPRSAARWLWLAPGLALVSALSAASLFIAEARLGPGLAYVVMGSDLVADPGSDLSVFRFLCLLQGFYFATWLALYFILHFYRYHRLVRKRRAALESLRTEAELHRLATQLGPHFLFNALNTIRGLSTDPVARDAITRLASLLRATLAHGTARLVTLREEITLVENYLALERLRHGPRLQASVDIPDALLERPLPPFTVQTLVENAIKHGLEAHEGPQSITITATAAPPPALAGTLTLRVTNTGRLHSHTREHPGLGLANARQRLHLLHGPSARLDLEAHPYPAPGLITATLHLPPPLAALP
jgi:hypothetical protein